MLQPKQQQADPLLIARIVWAALNFSILTYGFVLFTVGKVSGVFVPQGELLPLEMLALGANFIALGVFFFHKNSVALEKDFQKKFTGYIICWAMNEAIVLFGFVAVFTSESGNGFLYLTNMIVALTGNILTFPKK